MDDDASSTLERDSRMIRPLTEDSVDDDLIWALVDAAPDALVVIDDNGVIAMVNTQTETLFGYQRGQLLGQPVEVLLPEALRSAHRAHRTRYRVDPVPRAMGEGTSLWARAADGSEFPVEVSLSPARSNDRQWIIAAVRDVTNRLEAERNSRAIRHAIDTAVDGIFIVDDKTMEFIYVNNEAADMHGYSVEEMHGMTPLHLAPDLNDEHLAQVIAPLEAGDTTAVTIETTALRRDGSTFPVEVHINHPPQADHETRQPFVAVVRDITDRVNAAQELVEQRARSRVLADRERLARDLHDRVIGDLFAHGMTLQSITSRIPDNDTASRVQDTVTGLDEVIRLLRATIFDLSSTSEAGPRTQIQDRVASMADRLGHLPNLTLNGAIDDLHPDLVDEVTAVIHEALINVAKHAKATTTDVTIETNADRITLTVADNGVGVSETENPATTGGLGLTNIRNRAADLDGYCTVNPGPEGGLIITWTVPIK